MCIISKVSEPHPFGNFAVELKKIRRKLGFSQIDLADLLKVSQSNISRWENGYEEIPQHIRNGLLNVLSNQKGDLNPILRRMVKTNPSLTLLQQERADCYTDSRWLHYAPRLANYFQLEQSDVAMARSSQYFDPSWRPHVHNALLTDDRVMIDFERDYIATAGAQAGRSCRLRSCQHVVEFEGYSRVTVSTSTILGAATGQASVIHTLICADDLVKPKNFFSPVKLKNTDPKNRVIVNAPPPLVPVVPLADRPEELPAKQESVF